MSSELLSPSTHEKQFGYNTLKTKADFYLQILAEELGKDSLIWLVSYMEADTKDLDVTIEYIKQEQYLSSRRHLETLTDVVMMRAVTRVLATVAAFREELQAHPLFNKEQD